MARGKKTGGRNFPKGSPGRPKGAKDHVSRKGIREMFENIAARSGSLVEVGIERRLTKGEARLVELAAAYLDGRPVQRVALETPQPITFILRAAPPTSELPP